jgi:hypothetical protein
MKKIVVKTSNLFLLFFVVLCAGCQDKEINNVTAMQVIIDQPEVTLNPGETMQLTATVTPDNAGNKVVSWSSARPRIAEVADGLITAVSPGTTTVTAIAYSNADVRGEIKITVTGISEDVVTAVAGTYTGTAATPIGPIPADLTMTPNADMQTVQLTTAVDLSAANMGTLFINIKTEVWRENDVYKIAGGGDTPGFGPVSVEGSINDEGNVDCEFKLENIPGVGPTTVTYTGKNQANIADIVTGTYNGNVVAGVPVGIDVKVAITREDNKYKLTIDDVIAGYPFKTTIEIDVLRSGDVYTISGGPSVATITTPGGDMTTQATITSGTITAAGSIAFDIEILGLTNLGAPTNTATYTGQKLENLAKTVAGTYKGTVSLMGTPVSSNDIEMTLTVGDPTTVKWTTSAAVTLPPPYGAQTFTVDETHNFTLTVAGGNGSYTLAGSGNSSLGPISSVSGTINATGNMTLTIDAGLGAPITYEGQKQ